MINKKQSRLRRARATRARILLQKVDRLTVHRTNLHIYASIISADNGRTLVSASTVEPEVRAQLANVSGRGGNIAAAKIVGARLAEKAKAAGIEKGRKGPDHGGTPKQIVGHVKRDEVRKIAEYKLKDLNVDSIEAAMRCIEGSAKSMGIAIDD